jgi:3-oxoacyl-[acyl-carrier protein] reductase
LSDLKGKTAVVTGAGKGIGRAIALALARQHADVVVAARTHADVQAVQREIEELGGRSLSLRADVRQENDVERLVQQTVNAFGKVDILVNNAGVGYFSRVVDMRVEDFDDMFATNMRGVFLCTRAVLPHMIQRHSGDIINIASLAGRNAFIGGAGYAATKWALIGFARSLMLEVREHDIRVITICPGSVDTGFDRRPDAKTKDKSRIPQAEDIARVVIDALLMPRNVMVSEIDVRPTNPNWK